MQDTQCTPKPREFSVNLSTDLAQFWIRSVMFLTILVLFFFFFIPTNAGLLMVEKDLNEKREAVSYRGLAEVR